MDSRLIPPLSFTEAGPAKCLWGPPCLELKLPSKMVIMLVLKVSYRLSGAPLGIQGAVTPIGTVVTAKTGVKKWSTGQRVVLPLVKGSRTIFITWYCKIVESQDI